MVKIRTIEERLILNTCDAYDGRWASNAVDLMLDKSGWDEFLLEGESIGLDDLDLDEFSWVEADFGSESDEVRHSPQTSLRAGRCATSTKSPQPPSSAHPTRSTHMKPTDFATEKDFIMSFFS